MNIISVLSAIRHIHSEIKLLVLHNLDSRNIAGSLSYTREPTITQLYMEVIFQVDFKPHNYIPLNGITKLTISPTQLPLSQISKMPTSTTTITWDEGACDGKEVAVERDIYSKLTVFTFKDVLNSKASQWPTLG